MLQELHFVADSFQQEVNYSRGVAFPQNSVGIYQYVVTGTWLALYCGAMWSAGNL